MLFSETAQCKMFLFFSSTRPFAPYSVRAHFALSSQAKLTSRDYIPRDLNSNSISTLNLAGTFTSQELKTNVVSRKILSEQSTSCGLT